MDMKIQIGERVISTKSNKVGTVTEVNGNDKIKVDFGKGEIKLFKIEDAFKGGFLVFEKQEKQSQLGEEPKRKKEEKKRPKESKGPEGPKNTIDENMLKSDNYVEHLKSKPIYNNIEVERKFNINLYPSSGVKFTDTDVVLISVIVKNGNSFVYHDLIEEFYHIHSGQGLYGDQHMTRGNLEIKNAALNGKKIHLLVNFAPKQYRYEGVYELEDYTYENDTDKAGKIRKEYKFRLKKVQ